MSLSSENSLRTHLTGHPRYLRCKRSKLIDHHIDCVLQLKELAFHINRDFLGQIAGRDGCGYGGDIAHLIRQITGHQIDVLRQILPCAGNAFHIGLAPEFAFCPYFPSNPCNLRCKGAELVYHRVDDFCSSQKVAFERSTFDFSRHVLG